jgi:hypothetical protein
MNGANFMMACVSGILGSVVAVVGNLSYLSAIGLFLLGVAVTVIMLKRER